MKKVAVVHYMPLEFYPPVTNLLNILACQALSLRIWSTKNPKNRSNYKHPKIKSIARSPFPKLKDRAMIRLLKYLSFNLQCFFGLLIYRPDVIMYYESYSAFPVYLYYKTLGKRAAYYIHYHEYESPEAYEKGMKIVKYYHRLEKRYIYKNAIWISQTNTDRLKLFKADHPYLDDKYLKTIPNFPPQNWQAQTSKTRCVKGTIKSVYVGSLSLKDTYIQEYCNWVISQKGKITFDIYAYNLHDDTADYLRKLNTPYINFYPDGINYDKLPKVLDKYNLGVILYKGNTSNFIYNAPNKLFEYLACGLAVIYPEVMLGIKPYVSEVVKPLNFLELPDIRVLEKMLTTTYTFNTTYTAERAFKNLIISIIH